MASLLEYVAFVKSQAAYHDRQSEINRRRSPQKSKLHGDHSERFKALAAALAEAAKRLDSPSLPAAERPRTTSPLLDALPDGEVAKAILANPLTITPEHLIGLPEELIRQLNISETDRFEANVVNLVKNAGGVMLLDNILIGLYLMTKESHQRQQLTNRLYRMMRKGLLYSVAGKKGVYTTSRPEHPEPIEPEREGDEEEIAQPR
jgi:hypothetical protein